MIKLKQLFGGKFKILLIIAALIVVLVIVASIITNMTSVKMSKSAVDYENKNFKTVEKELKQLGFSNIETVEVREGISSKDNEKIIEISIDGDNSWDVGERFKKDAYICIEYIMVQMAEYTIGEDVIGKDYNDILDELQTCGFNSVDVSFMEDLETPEGEDTIEKIVDSKGKEMKQGELYAVDTKIIIYVHSRPTIPIPFSYAEAKSMDVDTLIKKLNEAGFTNVKQEALNDLILGILNKEGEIESIKIDTNYSFEKNEKFRPDVEIVIRYHSFPPKESTQDTEKDSSSINNGIVEIGTGSNPITVWNCPEFEYLMTHLDIPESKFEEYSDKYAYRTVSFDGYIAGLEAESDGTYSFLIYPGDYPGGSDPMPTGMMINVSHDSLRGLPTDIRGTDIMPYTNIHVEMSLDSYKSGSHMMTCSALMDIYVR